MFCGKHFEKRGYKAPGTGSVNPDISLLEIGSFEGEGDLVLQDERSIFPQHIVLKVNIQPVPITDVDPQITYILNTEPYQPIQLYERNTDTSKTAQHLAIELIYDSVSQYKMDTETFIIGRTDNNHFDLEIPPDRCLYRKDYAYEQDPSPYQEQTLSAENNVGITGPIQSIGGKIIRPYGGCFAPHLPMTDWRQTYYEISHDKQSNTQFTLVQEVPSTNKPIFFFPTRHKKGERSLEEYLRKGEAQVNICAYGQKRRYKSISAQHTPHTHILHITFIPVL